MSVITLLLFFFGALLLFVLYRIRWQRCYQGIKGVRGPTPNFLLGNLGQLQGKPLYKRLTEWTKEYGKTFAYFEAHVPIVVSSDLTLLQDVFVRRFPTFNARKIFPMAPHKDSPNASMFVTVGDRWRRMRKVLRHKFSHSSSRTVMPFVVDALYHMEDALKHLGGEGGQNPVEFYEVGQRLTCDIICNWAFSWDVRSLQQVAEGTTEIDKEHIFYVLRRFFREEAQHVPAVVILTMIFPELQQFLFKFNQAGHQVGLWFDPLEKMQEMLADVVRKRHEAGEEGREDDILQTMIDSVKSVADKDNGVWMMNEEVISQSFLLLLAGFETSSTAMAFMVYELARRPDIQEKLRQEIHTHLGSSPMEDFSTVQLSKMRYITAFIDETLRFYPLATSVINRKAMGPVSVRCSDGSKIELPAGSHVVPDMFTIHYSQEIWGPLPADEFIPERHLQSDRKEPMSFLAFGAGPRLCMGHHVAQLELRMTLIMLVRRFRLETCTETESPLVLNESFSLTPKNGVRVKLVPL